MNRNGFSHRDNKANGEEVNTQPGDLSAIAQRATEEAETKTKKSPSQRRKERRAFEDQGSPSTLLQDGHSLLTLRLCEG